jgi:DNA polymerase I
MTAVSDENNSFILDISRSSDGIILFEICNGSLMCTPHEYMPQFLVSFPDPHLHYSMIEELESLFQMKECCIKTIYGELDGYAIQAGREVAEKIEQQTRHQVKLYNVDIRPEQRYCAQHKTAPGGFAGSDRFIIDPELPLATMEITCSANPHRSDHPESISITTEGRDVILNGPLRQLIDDLFDTIQSHDPDVILFPDYDCWSAKICSCAREMGLHNTLSRTGRFRSLSSRSYYSYGRMEHRLGAQMPEGRLVGKQKFTR